MKKLLIPVVALVVLLGAGGGVWYFVLGAPGMASGPEAEPTPVHVEGKLGPHIVLKERVFNLANGPGGTKHFLKLGTTIEFETTDPEWFKLVGEPLVKALEEFDHDELGSGRAIIEDTITTIVSGKKVEELASAEGKAQLREEIKHAIAEEIHEPAVRRVLFTSFITD